MSVFRRKVPAHYIPVHPDNIGKNDWIILLEAGTIVCPSAEKLRVARATLERKIVTKYNMLLRAKHFLVLEGYDPRMMMGLICRFASRSARIFRSPAKADVLSENTRFEETAVLPIPGLTALRALRRGGSLLDRSV
jgi:hypothetical protein